MTVRSVALPADALYSVRLVLGHNLKELTFLDRSEGLRLGHCNQMSDNASESSKIDAYPMKISGAKSWYQSALQKLLGEFESSNAWEAHQE